MNNPNPGATLAPQIEALKVDPMRTERYQVGAATIEVKRLGERYYGLLLRAEGRLAQGLTIGRGTRRADYGVRLYTRKAGRRVLVADELALGAAIEAAINVGLGALYAC